jgi:predicted O-methyltransferase YrrM
MQFLPPELDAYAEQHSSPEGQVRHDLNRQTHLKVLMPRMLSGHLQGNTLEMLARLLRPQRILEVGTYTGYSALCLAQGLCEGGILHTIDCNEELRPMVEEYVARAEMQDKIKLHIGNAADIIPTLDETFDLVFLDADKENYSLYYDLVIDKVRPGGLILADNVLWSGKVLLPDEEIPEKDRDTHGLKAFNRKVTEDPRVQNTLLPIRDGLMAAVKL